MRPPGVAAGYNVYLSQPAREVGPAGMQRALARTLLLALLGVTFLPVLLAQVVSHDCCAPKAQQHCPDHDESGSISAGACSGSHHCCTWLSSKQVARPGAIVRLAATADRAPAFAGVTALILARRVIKDHSGRSPPRYS